MALAVGVGVGATTDGTEEEAVEGIVVESVGS